MGRTAIAAALLVAFTMPAFAEDATVKTEDTAQTTSASVSGTVGKEHSTKPIYAEDGRSDCMKRRSTTLNMM